MPVRHPVQPVDQLVDHLRERLDQRDARVGDVVVGPLRAALLHQALGVVDEILEVAGRRGSGRAGPSSAPVRQRGEPVRVGSCCGMT